MPPRRPGRHLVDRTSPLRVLLFANHWLGYEVLEGLLELGERPTVVVAPPGDPGETIFWPSVRELAEACGLQIYESPSPAHARFLAEVTRPAVIYSAGWRFLFTKETLAIPRHGAWNFHPSALPEYRGRCPVNWQIIEGKETGRVTLHRMVERADAGDVAGSLVYSLKGGALRAHINAAQAARSLLWLHKDIMSDQIDTRPMAELPPSYPGRTLEDGRLHPDRMTADEMHRMVQAVGYPYRGAPLTFGSKEFLVHRTSLAIPRAMSLWIHGCDGAPLYIIGAKEITCEI